MKFLRDLIPGLKYGFKILQNEIANYGIYTFGNVYWVDPVNGSDTNDGLTSTSSLATLAEANSKITTNNQDMILIAGTSTGNAVTSMLDFSKSRSHIVGLGVGMRKYGQRARITMGVTATTTDVFMLKNTGVGNSFSNIKFSTGNTLSQAIAAVGEGGEYSSYSNCEFYNSTDLDSDTTAELVLNGDSAQFFDCTFGSLADSVSGNKVRPAVYMAKDTVGAGKVSRDVLFDGCFFWKNAGGTSTAMVKIAADADIERFMEFHNCQFISNVLGSTPAVAIASPTLTTAQVLLTGDTAAHHCTKIATATGIFSALSAKVATATIGIQTT